MNTLPNPNGFYPEPPEPSESPETRVPVRHINRSAFGSKRVVGRESKRKRVLRSRSHKAGLLDGLARLQINN